jgi:hypothetical protein
MPTKSYTLILYRLRDHSVQSQTKSFFSTVPKRDSSVSEAKKIILGHRYGLPDFLFLFLFELATCVQNLIFTKVVEGCQKKYFPQRGMLKFTFKGRFLTIKIAYEKFLN